MGALATIGTVTQPTLANESGENAVYAGVAYDPVTAEVLDDAEAHLNYRKNGVTGQVHIGNETFHISESDVESGDKDKRWEFTNAWRGDRDSHGVPKTLKNLRVTAHGDGELTGRLVRKTPTDGNKEEIGFSLSKRSSSEASSTSGLVSDIRNGVEKIQNSRPDSHKISGSVEDTARTERNSSEEDDVEIAADEVDVEMLGGTDTDNEDLTFYYTSGMHGYDNHSDYDVGPRKLHEDYGNRFHIQSYFPNGDQGVGDHTGRYVDYRIERDDKEIEFENWFPTDEFAEQSDNWNPSFSIGASYPGIPFSVGVGSIRPTEKQGEVLARSRQYVDWHITLNDGILNDGPLLPTSQDETEGVQVDIRPMNADENQKWVTFTSQYGYLQKIPGGRPSQIEGSTPELEYSIFLEITS